jgi:biotin carboxyl carrier protein
MTRSTTTSLGILLVALGCSRGKAGGPSRVPVTIARAEQRAVPYEITAPGTVEPRQTVSVQSQVTGVLTDVGFREGDDVETGQVLFRIDPRPFQAALEQAQAILARDLAQAKNAQLDADRYADLVKQDYVTKSDYDAKRATADALTATVRGDSAAVVNAELNRNWATVRAPIAGRTGRLLVRPGNLVRANADPLVVINQIHPILVRFAVPEASLAEIQRYRRNRLAVLVSPSKQDTAFNSGVLTFVTTAWTPPPAPCCSKPSSPTARMPSGQASFSTCGCSSTWKRKPCRAHAGRHDRTAGRVCVRGQPRRHRPDSPVTVEGTSGSYTVLSQLQSGDQVVPMAAAHRLGRAGGSESALAAPPTRRLTNEPLRALISGRS